VQHTVLLIVTSHDRLGNSAQGTGAWLEELAQAYFVFADAKLNVEIASPRGGSAPLDPSSCAPPWLSPTGERFLADATAMSKVRATLALGALDVDRYSGIYLVGGAGAIWDLPESVPLGVLIGSMVERRRPVAAVCHGVGGLAAARDRLGEPLVRKRKVTAFSNAEEDQVGYTSLLPVLPENLLRSLGADYSCAEPWQEHVVADDLVLTGQNPASAAPLARALLRRLTPS
jgi:putative intracellular protease/amidase